MLTLLFNQPKGVLTTLRGESLLFLHYSEQSTCSRNIPRYISCLNRQCLRVTVSTVVRFRYYSLPDMLGWERNPHICGKVTYALLESQPRSTAYFSQDSPHVPCCRLDISLVNHFLLRYTGARSISPLRYNPLQALPVGRSPCGAWTIP
jgi:hypothetical protein